MLPPQPVSWRTLVACDLSYTLISSVANDYSGKTATISGWGNIEYEDYEQRLQPFQCALKEGIVEVRME